MHTFSTIPSRIGELKNLLLLDLASLDLSGTLPPQLGDMDSVVSLEKRAKEDKRGGGEWEWEEGQWEEGRE